MNTKVSPNISDSIERAVEDCIDESIYIEQNSKAVSTTSNITSICRNEDTNEDELGATEIIVWSEERTTCLGRVILTYSPDFIYIKWTRVLVENKGIGTAIWYSIVQNSDRRIFAKPVHSSMKHIAEKLGFGPAGFDNKMVVKN